ncbi:hypothetical protein ID214_000821 [Salmonella enterica subsp. enterica serovar Hvittingfoss]|nr:hypothetical protein [Salmonella enterica subsp. enterica serovar Hvittingfoss]
MTTITNNKLPEWRTALDKCVENYQSTRAWYEENRDSPAALDDMERAEDQLANFVRKCGFSIVLGLLDEMDELQELRRNYLALRGEIEDVRSQLYEAENQANEYASELQEHRKAAAEPVLYVMGMGCAFDAETASTCKGAVDSWVGEWNQERLPGQEEYKTVPLYTAPPASEREQIRRKNEPVAYLVCNGHLYQDRPFLDLSTARKSVKDRNDGAEIKALCVCEISAEK